MSGTLSISCSYSTSTLGPPEEKRIGNVRTVEDVRTEMHSRLAFFSGPFRGGFCVREGAFLLPSLDLGPSSSSSLSSSSSSSSSPDVYSKLVHIPSPHGMESTYRGILQIAQAILIATQITHKLPLAPPFLLLFLLVQLFFV